MRLIEHFNEQATRLIVRGEETGVLQRLHDEYTEKLQDEENGVIMMSFYKGSLRAIDAELAKRSEASQ